MEFVTGLQCVFCDSVYPARRIHTCPRCGIQGILDVRYEGLKLNDKAFRSNPANPWRLEDTKGWGLHKLGKDKQALQILQKCWDARPDYQHRVFLHLEEVKKAVTGQK